MKIVKCFLNLASAQNCLITDNVPIWDLKMGGCIGSGNLYLKNTKPTYLSKQVGEGSLELFSWDMQQACVESESDHCCSCL